METPVVPHEEPRHRRDKPENDVDRRGLLAELIGDGRPLLAFTGLCLLLSGAFALFLSATGSFLPHDVDFLGMRPEDLCAIHECRIVHFMIHDRASFGGVIIAIGLIYLWLSAFPLKAGEPWAWWAFVISGVLGFASFLAYLGYGYLDTWHGVATLALLPFFLIGLGRTRQIIGDVSMAAALREPAVAFNRRAREGLGRWCLLATGMGMIGAGAVIMGVGMTCVFVPEDLKYLGLQPAELDAINPQLIPLIAHDRAGFGGGLVSCGTLVSLCAWKGRPSVHLWENLALAGGVGFGCAIGVHYPIGYIDAVHLAPAWAGAVLFVTGMVLVRPSMGLAEK